MSIKSKNYYRKNDTNSTHWSNNFFYSSYYFPVIYFIILSLSLIPLQSIPINVQPSTKTLFLNEWKYKVRFGTHIFFDPAQIFLLCFCADFVESFSLHSVFSVLQSVSYAFCVHFFFPRCSSYLFQMFFVSLPFSIQRML